MNTLSVAPHIYPTNAIGVAPVGHGVGRFDYRNRSDAKMPDLLDNPITFKEIEYQFATSGVYAIYCTHTDTYYIGQAVVVLRRLVDHFTRLRDGRHQNDTLQKEFDIFGEDNFMVDLVVDMPMATQVELKVRETKEIQRFKSHGKRLYNKVSASIKLGPSKPRPKSSSDSEGGNGQRRMAHTEKVKEAEQVAATCYDCGTAGILVEDIFECDDGINRCQPCIKKYLDSWRVDFSGNGKGRKPNDGRKWYFTWQVPVGASTQEHIVLAAKRFAEKFGYMPTRVYLGPALGIPREEYKGIEVVKGGIAVRRFIQILIE